MVGESLGGPVCLVVMINIERVVQFLYEKSQKISFSSSFLSFFFFKIFFAKVEKSWMPIYVENIVEYDLIYKSFFFCVILYISKDIAMHG